MSIRAGWFVSGLTILLFAFPGSSLAYAGSGNFTDDDGLPAEPYIEWLAARGIVEGCDSLSSRLFCPDHDVSGAEAAEILTELAVRSLRLAARWHGVPDGLLGEEDLWDRAVSRLVGHVASHTVIDRCDPSDGDRSCPWGGLTRGRAAMLLVDVFGLGAPDDYASPWADTADRAHDDAARIAGYQGIWDASAGLLNGDELIDRAELATVLALAAGADLCPETPFPAGSVASVEQRYPSQSFTGYAYDIESGCAYWFNEDARLRTASVFKVMVMGGTLLEAQDDGRLVSDWESGQLWPMITESANTPVRNLWRHFGASPWFRKQTENFGLSQTTSVGDTQRIWGRTVTSAKDQGDLLRQVLLGDWGPLDDAYREQAWELMTSVVESQTWGVTSGVPSSWIVAQKNGFAGHIANSVGVVTPPSGEGGYVVVVLTNWWGDWHSGVPLVEEIAGWVSAALIDDVGTHDNAGMTSLANSSRLDRS